MTRRFNSHGQLNRHLYSLYLTKQTKPKMLELLVNIFIAAPKINLSEIQYPLFESNTITLTRRNSKTSLTHINFVSGSLLEHVSVFECN